MVLLNSVMLDLAEERCRKGTLEEAILLATLGHFGQRDGGKQPYILHPLAVLQRCRQFDETTQIVAVMHDLVEDNPFFTFDKLKVCGFSDVVIDALGLLYRPAGVTIRQAAEKLAAQDIRKESTVAAMRVKIADYHENSNIMRIPNPQPKDIDRCADYGVALQIVSKALAKRQ